MSESGESRAADSDAAASTLPESSLPESTLPESTAPAESEFTESVATETTVDPAGGAQPERSDDAVKRPKKYMRFVILALSTLCITQIMANQNSYNFTKICASNKTDPSANYTHFEKSMMQAGTSIGAFAALGPMVFLLERVPRRMVLLVCGGITTVATGAVPLLEPMGFGWFLMARIFQGVAFCATFPIAGFVTAQWASLTEHGIFLAFLTGFSQLSQIYLFSLGAIGCETFGWKSAYYMMAGTGVLVFALFGYFYTDRPHENSRVSPEELAWILKDKPEKNPQKEKVPYLQMIKSKVIWAVWTSAFADILAIQFLHMYVPQYFNDYLKFSIIKTGIYGALPMIVQWGCKIFSGWSSDKIKFLSETMKLKVYNSIALGGSGVFFMILSFIPGSAQWGCFTVLVMTQGLIGFNSAGFNKCGTLHARQHSHFVMVMKVAIQALCILIEPYITNNILGDTIDDQLRWGIVLWLHAVLLIAATVLFFFWARAEAAPWTEPMETEAAEDEDVEKGEEEGGEKKEEVKEEKEEKVEEAKPEEKKEEGQAEVADSTAPVERTMKETMSP